MNRKQFIESQGATCKNWTWSWSFVNESKRLVIFGAWDKNTSGKTAKILSKDWETERGHKQSGYAQALEHIRLIEEDGYRLMTFPMEYSESEDEDGPAKIKGFIPQLTEKSLAKIGNAWYAVDAGLSTPVALAEELSTPEKYSEGARFAVTINAYERNPKARATCIAHHGYICAVCGFDFVHVYGGLGKGFIHVHHVIPIGGIGKEYKIDPIADLIPVCPNCHAMVHRVEPPLTVEQLRKHISELKKS
jgi:5-methylcytosine-specific restriction protein A